MNEYRHKRSAAKCRPIIRVSRNIRYYAGIRDVMVVACIHYLFTANIMSPVDHGHSRLLASFRRSSESVVVINRQKCTLLRDFEWKTPNAKWAQKCQTFNSTIRPTMKPIIHHAKHIIDLHSVVDYYVPFQHFERTLMFIVQTMLVK